MLERYKFWEQENEILILNFRNEITVQNDHKLK